MKDKYLHTFRREPNEEFTNSLHQRLMALPPAQTNLRPDSRPSRKTRLAWVLAVLLLMLSIMAMIPAARARFEEIVQQIGGLTVLMTDIYPDTSDANIVPNDVMTLAEARARTELEFDLPTWVPEGLTMREEVVVSNILPNITITWVDDSKRGRAFSLHVGNAHPDVNLVVGPDSVTEVMIHDIPATLIRGGWYENTQRWQEDGPRSLRWQVDGIEYTLSTMMPEWGGLSEEELIQIAESFPQE
jgi:hypothetical protein